MSQDGRSVVEQHASRRTSNLQADHGSCSQQFGAESLRLASCSVGELVTRHTVREAEVILDPGALAGLTARRRALYDDGLQAFRRGIDGSAQTSRTATDDHYVVELTLRSRGQADRIGYLEQAGLHQRLALPSDHHRRLALLGTGCRQQVHTLWVADVVPAIGHHIARQEISYLVRGCRPRMTQDLDLVFGR